MSKGTSYFSFFVRIIWTGLGWVLLARVGAGHTCGHGHEHGNGNSL